MTSLRYHCALIATCLFGLIAWTPPAPAASFRDGLKSAIGDVADLIKTDVNKNGSRREIRELDAALQDLLKVFEHQGQGHGHMHKGMHHHHHHGHHHHHHHHHAVKSSSGNQHQDAGHHHGPGSLVGSNATRKHESAKNSSGRQQPTQRAGNLDGAKSSPKQDHTKHQPVAAKAQPTQQVGVRTATINQPSTPIKSSGNPAVRNVQPKTNPISLVGNRTGVKQPIRTVTTNRSTTGNRAAIKHAPVRTIMPVAKNTPTNVNAGRKK
jgi:hypothetical protein